MVEDLRGGASASAPSTRPPWRTRAPLYPDIDYAKDAYDCAAGADFLVLATEWNAFRKLDLGRLAAIDEVEDDGRSAQRLRAGGDASARAGHTRAWGEDEHARSRHRRRGIPRQPPLRPAPRRGPRSHRDGQPPDGQHAEHRAPPGAAPLPLRPAQRRGVRLRRRARSTPSSTSPRRPPPSTTSSFRSRRSRSARSERTTRSGSRWPRAPVSCSPRPRRSTGIRSFTRSPRPTGATSTRSAPAASTTRPSASPRPSRWPTTAPTASTPASSGSSTPTASACARATAASFPP